MQESENKKYSIKFISELINAKVEGNLDLEVVKISAIEDADAGSITFLATSKFNKYVESTDASAVIVPKGFKTDQSKTYLICSDPYLAYAKLTKLFSGNIDFENIEISKNSFIHETAFIGSNVNIGPSVFIGENCVINNNSILYPNTTIVKNVIIGENTIVHSNTVLGSDGFGFAPDKESYKKIEQLGGLYIGNDVEIGAGCTIDRGAITDTVIGNGVKLDNQIHIAHNVSLGSNSAIAACCAIAGSTKIGKNFKMGGLSGVLGHLEVCDDVTVGAHTLITKSIKSSGNFVGIMPAQNHMNWSKSAVFIKKRGK